MQQTLKICSKSIFKQELDTICFILIETATESEELLCFQEVTKGGQKMSCLFEIIL